VANHFRQTAETLRELADAPNARLAKGVTEAERQALRRAADLLCRLEKLKRDLVSSAVTEDEADSVSADLLALLGLHGGS